MKAQWLPRECFAALIANDASDRVAEPLTDDVNTHVTGKRGISSQPCKVTEAEVKKFLAFLPPQLALAFCSRAPA